MEVLNSGVDEECSVCLSSLKHPVITACAHVFCRLCISKVIEHAENSEAACPMCRAPISAAKLINAPTHESTEDANFDGTDWQSSAKVDALMDALVQLRQADPTVKSLVVSQFTSFLKILEKPLRENGFKFEKLNGSMSRSQRTAAIESFSNKTPEAPTVFLLSLKAGGVGLNLTAASRVFLLDPAWNPASEEQCFDRCHRLGQLNNVVITKFIVKDSVEERMLALQEKKRKLMDNVFDKRPSTAQRRKRRINDIRQLMDI